MFYIIRVDVVTVSLSSNRNPYKISTPTDMAFDVRWEQMKARRAKRKLGHRGRRRTGPGGQDAGNTRRDRAVKDFRNRAGVPMSCKKGKS